MRPLRVTGKAGDVASRYDTIGRAGDVRRQSHFDSPRLQRCQRRADVIITSLTEPTKAGDQLGRNQASCNAAAIATGSAGTSHAHATRAAPPVLAASSRVKNGKCRSAPVASAKSPAMITPSSGTTEMQRRVVA